MHNFVYFQHHKRLNRLFDLSALKKHLALLDCINTAAQSIMIITPRATFATFVRAFRLRFKIDVPSNTGMVAFYYFPVKSRWQ